MEQQYLIGVANKFAALEDEEDNLEIIKFNDGEKQKKKALKAVSSIENKENKAKDNADPKVKSAVKKQPPKPTADRVLVPDKSVKADNQVDRKNQRNRDDRPAGTEFQRPGPRDNLKQEGGPPRGPRPDGNNRGEKRDGPRPFRGEPRGPRPDGDSRPPRPDRQPFDDSRPPRKDRDRREPFDNSEGEGRPDRRPSGPRGGRGGPRPAGPGRNFDTRGKREFDRRSGSDRTGVKAVDKRDGAGPYNWDSNKDLAALATNDLNITSNSDDQPEWDESSPKEAEPIENKEGGEPTIEDAPAVPEVEEPKELTLDEYRALRGKREQPKFDIRKPGEGEDLTQWKDMVEMKKKLSKEAEEDDDLEIQDYPQRVGRQRHVVGIDITFNDPFRGRGRGRGGGGRGGGRGRDDRGGDRGDRDRDRGDRDRGDRGDRDRDRGERGDRDRDRGERRGDRDFERGGGRQSAPKVDDERDFPSLG